MWGAAHGGDVAEVAFEEFGSGELRRGVGGEVTTEDDGIDRVEQVGMGRDAEDGTIVPNTLWRRRRDFAQNVSDALDETGFVEGGGGFVWIVSERGYVRDGSHGGRLV